MNRITNSLLCLAIAAPLAAQADRDEIRRKTGKPISNVKILKLEKDKITYAKSGNESEIATDQVAGHRFGSAPESFDLGHSANLRGNNTAAAALFDQAAKAATEDVIKLAATFFCGRAFTLAAMKDPAHANNAVAKLQEYVTGAPNGLYIAEAKVRLAQANLAGGDAAGAETMLTGLETEAISGSWPLFWAAQIKLTKARAQYAQNKHTEARSTFQAVSSAVAAALGQDSEHNSELQRMQTEGLVMQGETYVGEKLLDDALQYYQSLTNNTSRGVKAAALAGKGQILYLQGADKNDNQKLRQAQIDLATASIEPDTSDTTSAKALYFMGMVLVALDDAEANSQARAKSYFQSVKNNFGTTEWAAKARKELEK